MPGSEFGSITKEPPIAALDRTIALIYPGIPYSELLKRARKDKLAHPTAPGLIRTRFLLVENEKVVYDRFLSLVAAYGVSSPLVRKVMYFTWAWRDPRLRRFICEVVANDQGLWQPTELKDIGNRVFFKEWLSASSQQKARSNIEFFLKHAGIFNDAKGTVHLELSDGWLAEAMTVAAQHEPDRALRAPMVADPLGTLRRLGLLGLVNLSTQSAESSHSQPVAELAQVVEDSEEAAEYPTSKAREWEDRAQQPIQRSSKEAVIDPIALERANASHLRLERIAAAAIKAAGHKANCSQAIDMYFPTPDGTPVLEFKSCHDRNFHSQVRRGVSQLLEYEFLYGKEFGSPVTKALLLEIEPPAEKRWLIDYLNSIGILLAWKDPNADRFLSAASIPKALVGVVAPA